MNPTTANSLTLDFTLPSGRRITIREQNGNDEEVISLISNNDDNSALTKFLMGIIVSSNPETTRGYTFDEIRKWRPSDISYTLLKSRIFSLGNILVVEFKCPHCGKKHEQPFEEELSKYVPDMGAKQLSPGEPGYFKYACKPITDSKEDHVKLTLASGKQIKWDYMRSDSESKLLDLPPDSISVGTALRLRNLSLKVADEKLDGKEKYLKLERFDVFSSRDMVEIRKSIAELDPQFTPISDYTCTNPRCGRETSINLLGQPDFFFPGVIS